MSRSLIAGSLVAAAGALLMALPAAADRTWHSRLDEVGRPVGTGWTQTGRFSELTAAGMDDVRFVTGPDTRIRATGDARALAQLRFTVEDGTLVVGRTSNQRERFGKVRVEITAPALRAATSAGSGMLDVDRLAGPRASATVAGSGGAAIHRVQAEQISATVAGSGTLRLTGRGERARVTVAGSGSLMGADFTAGSADITVAGSGSARFRSTGQVSATIAGSGSATVTGTTQCRQTRMGSGRLDCRR